MSREWLTYLQERDAGGAGRTFDVYLVRDEHSAWLELGDSEPLQVGLLDLANEHVPPGVLRVRWGLKGRMVFGILVGAEEVDRLRSLLAFGRPRDRPLGRRSRRSALAG